MTQAPAVGPPDLFLGVLCVLVPMRLRDCGIRLFGIDAVRLDRLLHDRRVDLPVARERAQGGDDHVAMIDFEEFAQRRRGFRCGRTRRCRARPSDAAASDRSMSGSALHDSPTRRRTRPARLSGTAVTYGTRGFSAGCSMFHRSHGMRLAIELVVARDAPDVGADAVLRSSTLLRLHDLVAESRRCRTAARAAFAFGVRRRAEAVQPLQDAVRAPSGIGGIAYCSFITVR